ncbi:hypothetical protein KUH03_37340 [Sphingobacterium sp. E70]|uniref:hypothetical protein n=1 Tax=Sphingobacterium sp. E70 TaxID=2853439 RepID=UPI00211CE8A6|nr:hypothetical protein [Sphingobacterium sp. E70]ULT24554.1 hypothetical protein KUH03_37340 [Sphingobacterium sp. E70]
MNIDKKKSLLLLAAVALGTVAYNALKPVISRPDVVDPFDLDKYLENGLKSLDSISVGKED